MFKIYLVWEYINYVIKQNITNGGIIPMLRKKSKGFTLIELMVVIVIIGILVAIALPNFIAAQDRAKLSSVKANMHTLQTIAETYAVDWGGVYAADLTGLKDQATSNNYWKELKNPFSAQVDPGVTLTTTKDNTAVAFVPVVKSGGVAYMTANTNTQYAIYGAEKKEAAVGSALPIMDKGNVFYLTNN